MIPGPSSLGAKWYRYRVSIHHLVGFNWHPLEGAGVHELLFWLLSPPEFKCIIYQFPDNSAIVTFLGCFSAWWSDPNSKVQWPLTRGSSWITPWITWLCHNFAPFLQQPFLCRSNAPVLAVAETLLVGKKTSEPANPFVGPGYEFPLCRQWHK